MRVRPSECDQCPKKKKSERASVLSPLSPLCLSPSLLPSPSAPSYYGGHSKKAAIKKPGRRLSPEFIHAVATLILDFQHQNYEKQISLA